MSVNSIETLLWKVSGNPETARRLREETELLLKEFNLESREKTMLTQWDVSALAAHGVNPLLLVMSFAAVNGIERMGEYDAKINPLDT